MDPRRPDTLLGHVQGLVVLGMLGSYTAAAQRLGLSKAAMTDLGGSSRADRSNLASPRHRQALRAMCRHSSALQGPGGVAPGAVRTGARGLFNLKIHAR